ncbi:MAG: HAD family hydrolase [Actinobacteria bacterium]|nr:MAG: HAD family hydrolase [Actinomycetota bacterium]
MADPLVSRIEAIECVLFDLDGTLIDTLNLILESMRYTTATVLGEALPDDVLMHNVGVPLAVQMEEFAPGRADELLAVYREHNARVHDVLVREYPGVDDGLAALSEAGFRMAVVTSKLHLVAQRGLDRFSLGRFFEFLLGSDDVARHKPDPEPLLHAARLLGVAPERCAYVGDSPHDVSAARAAGMVAVAAQWGVASRERLVEAGAEYLADSMAEVVAIFSGHEGAYRA